MFEVVWFYIKYILALRWTYSSKHVACVVEHNKVVVFDDKIQILYY